MGIDIYLNGYEEYQARTAEQRAAFDRAVAERDRRAPRGTFHEGNPEHDALQAKVSEAADSMWSGSVGYLRSSYNGSGLFRVLEEIYGFDVAAYLFPGKWEGDVAIDGREFCIKVGALERTALAALKQGRLALPWTDVFTEVTGERAVDPSEQRARAEAFGDSVFSLITAAGFDADKIEGGPAAPHRELSADHRWYLTDGMKDLRDFGELAARINAEGRKTFAYISY